MSNKLLHLLLVLFLTQHSVDSASVVSYLPGFDGPLPFHLETGYIGVGEEEKVQLFYYFIKSENNPKEDPLLIWLTGGPACSTLSALAFEIGPLTFKTDVYNGSLPSLVSTSYSWTKVASIIFLDQPVGTGFSYSTTPLANKPSDTGVTEQTYEFLQKEEKVQLFYYFIKSENNPKEDPLLIWLTGGPACTSFSALTFEIGPLTFKTDVYNGSLPSLVSTSYSWTKVASIIFLDQPVGTGFSYSTTPLANKPSDTRVTEQTYEFLQKWLVQHPEFVSNPFYVGGDSYSSIIVPATLQRISIGNEHGYKPLVNLKGYVLGNPITDYDHDRNHRIPFAHGMGLISDELHESLKRSCKGNYVRVDPTNTECLELMDDYNKCVSRINIALILTPLCDYYASPNPFSEEHIGRRDLRRLVKTDLSDPTSECYTYRYFLATKWANDEDVRRALHVVKGSIGKWVRCVSDFPYEYDIKSSVPYHRNNSFKGYYRSLIYSGDHDMIAPFVGTQAWIRSLNYSIIDQWRPWFVNNQVIGYTRTYANNMTFGTIKGGGHTAEYKPEESFLMFQRWIRDQPL